MSARAWLVGAALLLVTVTARAQSIVEIVPDNPCERALGLPYDDESPAAQQIRRACHLERFERRLTIEREGSIVSAEMVRDAKIERWVEQTQPARATKPFFVDAFLGSGIATYGLTAGWDVLKSLELAAWIGRRSISCDGVDNYGNPTPGTADCSRVSYGFHGRWYILMTKLTPFLGTGLTITSAHLQVVSYPMGGGSMLEAGEGRANSFNLSGGLQIAVSAFRLSVEYVYEHAFYTGASLDDAKKTPSTDLDTVWSSSLKQDQNGIRVQVGYAF
ncbi:MAG TPA: hypothetical protein VMT03_27380 [Polyangia bacterium]|nr:hypothetical protein [Polyangia bacterium]